VQSILSTMKTIVSATIFHNYGPDVIYVLGVVGFLVRVDGIRSYCTLKVLIKFTIVHVYAYVLL